MIPYGHQSIDEEDIAAVASALRSDRLTQGPAIQQFEEELAQYAGTRFAVVASSGTAALQAAYFAAGLSNGDEFITSPMTFVSTATAGVWLGAKPVLVDIDPTTGNINADLIEAKITPKTKAIVPIDYTGRPADLDVVSALAKKHGLIVIEDACQALGATHRGRKIGSISDMTVFSFHPVKSITTGEGGAVLTNSETFYNKMKAFVSHGIVKDQLVNPTHGDWYFEMQDLGLNYRMTDFQCALGMSQLKKVDRFIEARKKLADRYAQLLAGMGEITLPPGDSDAVQSAWHLYVIRLRKDLVARKREIFAALRSKGVGVQVHHIPVYTHPYYQKKWYDAKDYPACETLYTEALSIPLYPGLTDAEQDTVVSVLKEVLQS